MKEKFFHILMWLVIKTKIYLYWSRLIQFLFQHKRKEIPKFNSIDDIMDIIATSQWTKDPWWMAWDAFSHPKWAYNNYTTRRSLGDCDDFAAFSAYCLQQLDYINVNILSIQWLDYKNSFHGHNVCIWNPEDNKIGLISNGFNQPLYFDNIEKAIHYWPKSWNGKLLSWCIISPDLKHIIKYKIGN